MIIRRMQSSDRAAVLNLTVTDAQKPYVGTMQDILDNLKSKQDCHVIEVEAALVGFFIIDCAYADQYDFCAKTDIGFRAYLIDKKQQGKGYGQSSMKMLKDYLRETYPTQPGVVLTVNCRNEIAYKIYVASGFVDTQALYHGGEAGPQHILRMPLIV